MNQYHKLFEDILANGRRKGDRTGTGTLSVFGRQMRFDLSGGKIPLVTTKFVNFEHIVRENLWFLSGDTNNRILKENGVNIWNQWADAEGNLGPVYGAQWRRWPKIVKKERPITLEERVRLSDCQEARDLYFKIKQAYIHKTKGYARWVSDLNDLLDSLEVPRTREEKMVDGSIDQITEVINLLKTKPDSRRIMVNAWNINDLPDESVSPQDNVEVDLMALPPCHTLFQFYTDEMTLEERQVAARRKGFDVDLCVGSDDRLHHLMDGIGVPRRRLSCQLYQRSADTFLGLPWNIAGYSLLTIMIAQVVGMEPGEFIWSGGDVHIYTNHFDQVEELLERVPSEAPTLRLNPDITDIDDFTVDDFHLVGYNPQGRIKAPVAI